MVLSHRRLLKDMIASVGARDHPMRALSIICLRICLQEKLPTLSRARGSSVAVRSPCSRLHAPRPSQQPASQKPWPLRSAPPQCMPTCYCVRQHQHLLHEMLCGTFDGRKGSEIIAGFKKADKAQVCRMRNWHRGKRAHWQGCKRWAQVQNATLSLCSIQVPGSQAEACHVLELFMVCGSVHSILATVQCSTQSWHGAAINWDALRGMAESESQDVAEAVLSAQRWAPAVSFPLCTTGEGPCEAAFSACGQLQHLAWDAAPSFTALATMHLLSAAA